MSIDILIKGASKWIPNIEDNCVIDRNGKEIAAYHLCDRYWLHVLFDDYGYEIQLEDYNTNIKFNQDSLTSGDFLMSETLEYMEKNIPAGDFYEN